MIRRFSPRSVRAAAGLLIVAATGAAGAQQVPDVSFRPPIEKPAFSTGRGPTILIEEAHANFHAADGRASIAQQPASPDCSDYDRVEYSAPRRDLPSSITIESVQGDAPDTSDRSTSRHRSPHGTAKYIIQEPDTTRPGPWMTVVEVFGNKARPLHLRIRLTSDGTGEPRVAWLNEKLLWLQLWRGRIVSTDAILDVETGQLIYEQDANYNSFVVPCSMKAGVRKQRG